MMIDLRDETSVFTGRTTDGRYIRIEKTYGDVLRPMERASTTRIFVDDVEIDATGLARRHEGDTMILETSIGPLELTR